MRVVELSGEHIIHIVHIVIMFARRSIAVICDVKSFDAALDRMQQLQHRRTFSTCHTYMQWQYTTRDEIDVREHWACPVSTSSDEKVWTKHWIVAHIESMHRSNIEFAKDSCCMSQVHNMTQHVTCHMLAQVCLPHQAALHVCRMLLNENKPNDASTWLPRQRLASELPSDCRCRSRRRRPKQESKTSSRANVQWRSVECCLSVETQVFGFVALVWRTNSVLSHNLAKRMK